MTAGGEPDLVGAPYPDESSVQTSRMEPAPPG